MENWKDITGYAGIYQVSDMGRVRSLDKRCRVGKNGRILKRGRILKQSIRMGYAIIELQHNRVSTRNMVHRLVATEFVPNPDPVNKIFVNHIVPIKTLNKAENLEWCTRQENMNHAVKHNLMRKGWVNKKSKAAA